MPKMQGGKQISNGREEVCVYFPDRHYTSVIIMKVKRLQQMEEYIKSKGLCSYDELSEHFDISMSTTRRDVSELKKRGKIVKTYGGVMGHEDLNDSDSTIQLKYGSSKDKMAEMASRLVEDGEIILLGSGSTVAHMVHHLADKKNLTVITNNLIVVEESMRYGFKVINLGGNLDRNTMSFVGVQSIRQLKELNANKSFISCNGITIKHGLSNITDLEADIKKAIIKISSQVITLVDHVKFDKMSLYTFANMDEIDVIVTDREPSADYIEAFQKAHTELLITG